jgi:hypothetical protein
MFRLKIATVKANPWHPFRILFRLNPDQGSMESFLMFCRWMTILGLILSSCLLFADDLTLSQLIEKHNGAVGGKEAVQATQSVRIKLTIQEPTFEVDGVYVADRKLRMRIDIYDGDKRVFTEAYDGKNAWEMGENQASAKDTSAEGTIALRNGIISPDKLFGLDEVLAMGTSLQLQGRQEIDGINYYVVRFIPDPKDPVDLYIHPETWLIDRSRQTKALHPDIDPTLQTVEARYSDFRKVDGVLRSFKTVSTNLKTGQIVQTDTIHDVQTNVELSDQLFAKPVAPVSQ